MPFWKNAVIAVAAAGATKLYLNYRRISYPIEIDLKGKSYVITGATSGIGKATALELAKHGATVHIACRNPDAGFALAEEIRRANVNADVRVWNVDVGDLHSVREFASSFLKSGAPIHVLINNAGVGGFPSRDVTKDGLERTMAVNHYGPFLLTSLLFDRLKENQPSRIVNVASVVHMFASKLPLDDLNFEKRYSPFRAYCRSKLANVLFTFELSQRAKGSGVIVNCVHPGSVRTNLFDELPWYKTFWRAFGWIFYRTPLQGAQTVLYAAVAPECASITGKYFNNCKSTGVNQLALNEELRLRFWEQSNAVTGAKWP